MKQNFKTTLEEVQDASQEPLLPEKNMNYNEKSSSEPFYFPLGKRSFVSLCKRKEVG